jgi:hypothetical protein
MVAAAAFGWYLVTADTPARSSTATPAPAQAFVADLRSRQLPASLRRTSNDDLVALGERFCTDLRRTGNSLDVVFQDQLAGRVYDGQSEVVTAARRHLCPDVPDRAG